MGVESFFVKLKINNTNEENEEFLFNLLGKEFKVKKVKEYLVVNKRIEIEKDIEGKTQINLIASFSDYKNNIKLMNNIIGVIVKSIKDEIKVIILGKEFDYFSIDFSEVVEDKYKEKYNVFVDVYGDKQTIVTPKKFYRKSIIKNLFRK
ncbi:MAG: hypothetical protein GX275_06785 [Clostridiales bacterium]|nr:hypothetical protein [Clostridiales bacterium]